MYFWESAEGDAAAFFDDLAELSRADLGEDEAYAIDGFGVRSAGNGHYDGALEIVPRDVAKSRMVAYFENIRIRRAKTGAVRALVEASGGKASAVDKYEKALPFVFPYHPDRFCAGEIVDSPELKPFIGVVLGDRADEFRTLWRRLVAEQLVRLTSASGKPVTEDTDLFSLVEEP